MAITILSTASFTKTQSSQKLWSLVFHERASLRCPFKLKAGQVRTQEPFRNWDSIPKEPTLLAIKNATNPIAPRKKREGTDPNHRLHPCHVTSSHVVARNVALFSATHFYFLIFFILLGLVQHKRDKTLGRGTETPGQ